MEINRLENMADRVYRAAMAEIFDNADDICIQAEFAYTINSTKGKLNIYQFNETRMKKQVKIHISEKCHR